MSSRGQWRPCLFGSSETLANGVQAFLSMFRFVRRMKLRFSLAASLLAVTLVALFLGDAAMNARSVQNFRKLVADLNGDLFCRHELLDVETMGGLPDQVGETAGLPSWRDRLPPG